MTINYKQTVTKLSTETNFNVVNFVPLFSGHFGIWQHVSSPLWSQQPVHFKVITQGKNRKRLHTHIQLISYEDKWGGNYSVLNQCALETNWFDVDLVHRPLYILKLSFSFFNWLHIQLRASCRNAGTHQGRDSPTTSRTSSAGFFLLRRDAHHCQLVAAGSGPALVSRARTTHEIHSFSWSTTIQVALSDACQRHLLLW